MCFFDAPEFDAGAPLLGPVPLLFLGTLFAAIEAQSTVSGQHFTDKIWKQRFAGKSNSVLDPIYSKQSRDLTEKSSAVGANINGISSPIPLPHAEPEVVYLYKNASKS